MIVTHEIGIDRSGQFNREDLRALDDFMVVDVILPPTPGRGSALVTVVEKSKEAIVPEIIDSSNRPLTFHP